MVKWYILLCYFSQETSSVIRMQVNQIFLAMFENMSPIDLKNVSRDSFLN